jgi:hypothetical protein
MRELQGRMQYANVEADLRLRVAYELFPYALTELSYAA